MKFPETTSSCGHPPVLHTIRSGTASNWSVCRDGSYCPRMLHACPVIADGLGSLGGEWSSTVVVTTDKDINFYCALVFYLTLFIIEKLGRFGA